MSAEPKRKSGQFVVPTINSDMQLRAFLIVCYLPSNNVSPRNVQRVYNPSLKRFGLFIHCEPCLKHLTITNLIQFAALQESLLCKEEARRRMLPLIGMWRSASESGIIPWSDRQPTSELQEVLPFICHPMTRKDASGFIADMRANLGRAPVGSDITAAAVRRLIAKVPRKKNGRINYGKHQSLAAMAGELARLAGGLVESPGSQVEVPIARTLTSKSSLLDLVEDLARTRPVTKLTRQNYERAARYFGEHLGRKAIVEDLAREKVNSWLLAMEQVHSAQYCVSLRRDFKVVWNYAADIDLTPPPRSRLIRLVKVQRRVPKAWPVNWADRLIEGCKSLKGRVRRHTVTFDVYSEAYTRVALDLLCRPTDMRELRWDWIDKEGLVRWDQHKTGVDQARWLQPETLEAIDKLRGGHPELAFPLSKSAHERMIGLIFRSAGIEKPEGESFGHWRHTGGTAIASVKGNDVARQALGHLPTSRVFEQHYLERQQVPDKFASHWYAK